MPGQDVVSAGNSPYVGEKAAAGGTPAVLVLDDEALIRWTMHEGLGARGYRVLEAETGADALALARAERIDLVLLDLQLPDLDGLSVLTRMRAEGISCPAIVLTAYGTPETAERALVLGARSCVAKPFDLEELLRVIDGELGRA